MSDDQELLTAEVLDAMSPDERVAAFRGRIVTDLEAIPAAFRSRILDTARRLGAEHAG